MEKRKELDKYIDALNEMYEQDPDAAIKEASNSLERLGKKSHVELNKNILDDIDKDILFTVIVCIVLALLGLLSPNLDGIIVYLFGVVFFLAGLFIGITQKGFGIIFLFSHGMTGLAIMLGTFIAQILDMGLVSENPSNVYFYIGIALTIIILAVLFSILINLSDNLKKVKYIKAKIIGLYGIGILLIAILPRIIKIIIRF